jgi:hypothetical protein
MPAPHEMPAIYPFREYVDSSGLIDYGIPLSYTRIANGHASRKDSYGRDAGRSPPSNRALDLNSSDPRFAHFIGNGRHCLPSGRRKFV